MITKVCTGCSAEKPLNGFYKQDGYLHGVMSRCILCKKAYKKKHYTDNLGVYKEYHKDYYADNKGYFKEYNKIYSQENKEVLAEKNKIYRQENKGAIAARAKIHYQENREARLEYAKIYSQKCRVGKESYYAERSAARLANKKRLIPNHLVGCKKEGQNIKAVYDLSKIMSDHYGVKYHVDHMWPLDDGGPHWSGNLQIITAEDNLKKSNSVCEDVKRTIQESLDWEIRRYNNTKLTTQNTKRTK